MIKAEYVNAMGKGYALDGGQRNSIVLSVFELLADAQPIFFKKDGTWNPLKWNSIGRWIKLSKLSYRFIRMVIKIVNK